MKIFTRQKNRGFTLIETMVAVFILAVAMNALLGLISSSLYFARYAKNDIVANYLIQEVIDYVKNDRDTIAFQMMGDAGGGWNEFLLKYGYSDDLCFADAGCEIEPSNVVSRNINNCATPHTANFGTIDCRLFNYNESGSNKGFYTYQPGGPRINFKRQVKMSLNSANSPDQLDVEVTVEWLNGSLVRSRTSRVSLLNWQQ